jgi:hypothetical protein
MVYNTLKQFSSDISMKQPGSEFLILTKLSYFCSRIF